MDQIVKEKSSFSYMNLNNTDTTFERQSRDEIMKILSTVSREDIGVIRDNTDFSLTIWGKKVIYRLQYPVSHS